MRVASMFLAGMSLAGAGGAQTGTPAAMSRVHAGDVPVATAETTVEPAVPVTASTVTYATVAGKPIEGYLARPKAARRRLPGIIVIHEWWGLNDNVRAMTRRLAGEGYAALAVDLYRGAVATTPAEARALMVAALGDVKTNNANLEQAYAYLATKQHAPKVGVIGWCFGGGFSLQTAILLPKKIAACVIYYGHLATGTDTLAPLAMPILGIFGAEDAGIPIEDVRAFETALKALGKSVEIHVYPGAGHAFANPSGTRYVPAAAADAWQKTVAFFAANLK